jgi:hypothetical protein
VLGDPLSRPPFLQGVDLAVERHHALADGHPDRGRREYRVPVERLLDAALNLSVGHTSPQS